MPRPPKHVPPETLGGRIRAARERLHLSLAYVVGDRYSTSLLSQIERNRVEPSEESLHFLAERLHLPIEELQALAEQQHETEIEASQYKVYEELRLEANEALIQKRPYEVRNLLVGLNMSRIPSSLRWRLAALRGQCYFALRQFLNAQRDFMYAVTELPEVIPEEQRLEAMTLHLHLAAALREVEQLDAAFEQYQLALSMMNTTTSLHYIAEAHWGMALIAFERADKAGCPAYKTVQLQLALKHAENASILYRSIGETVRAALLTCQIGQIEQVSGKLDDARKHLSEVLQTWVPELDRHVQMEQTSATDKRRREEVANVVSAVACMLAGIELEAKNYEEALGYVQQAQYAGELSYKLRRAEADMMYGRILEASDVRDKDKAAEKAFRGAIERLADTERLAARIRAHDFLGRHLLKKGDTQAGEKELDHARRLSHVASAFISSPLLINDSDEDSSKAC